MLSYIFTQNLYLCFYCCYIFAALIMLDSVLKNGYNKNRKTVLRSATEGRQAAPFPAHAIREHESGFAAATNATAPASKHSIDYSNYCIHCCR
jgi:hypothetical protein